MYHGMYEQALMGESRLQPSLSDTLLLCILPKLCRVADWKELKKTIRRFPWVATLSFLRSLSRFVSPHICRCAHLHDNYLCSCVDSQCAACTAFLDHKFKVCSAFIPLFVITQNGKMHRWNGLQD